MGKVFTITEGLENMGALRTGGQGSIYKGKRIGEIISAVKLLPTPVQNENNDDKNYRDFKNEVEKLKKVNEIPNPNVVKILNSGITESGSFPFIEMEFIEGPDLEDLLKPPHDPIFTIKEVIKVADQLANALNHCHSVSVKHGDMKSNNVKFNINTGNYILLDFGLAIMSDEQRRTSLRHAGAVEFMAPEQNEGQMLFESDVYGYGVILYEILAGSVPFPLTGNGQTARNNVMVSHMETPVPDVLEIRRQNLPNTWTSEKKEWEMQVPQWLLYVINKCLNKDPNNRFKDGVELHQYLIQNSTLSVLSAKNDAGNPTIVHNENERLQSLLNQTKVSEVEKEREIASLKNILSQKEQEIIALKSTSGSNTPVDKKSVNISKPAFFGLLLLLLGLGAFATYSLIAKNESVNANFDSSPDSLALSNEDSIKNEAKESDNKQIYTETKKQIDSIIASDKIKNEEEVIGENNPPDSTDNSVQTSDNDAEDNDVGKVFSLAVSKTYFHNDPDASTQRKAFINHWNNARLTALDDRNGFIYISYKNDDGQVTKGWLRKSDLIVIGN